MPTLSIKSFACLDAAEIQIERITLLIGPQASGKSIISKLMFFFLDIPNRQFAAIEDQKSFEEFKAELVEDFKKWFPPSAWGKKKFKIRFSAGQYSAEINRSLGKTWRSKQRATVKLSPFFEREYKAALLSARQGLKKISPRARELDASREFELFWRIRSATERRMKKALGKEYVESQLFVPAGRSFFTSIGKAISALERGVIVDPLTVRFGRFFASLRDRGYFRRFGARLYDKRSAFSLGLSEEFFGGKLRTDRGEEYVESDDGRKIPVGMLSSGQQELLPLLLALENFRFRERCLIYIEEPEAHLFPTAQSDLVDYFSGFVRMSETRSLFITTHSPYVLARFNILLKAGALARRKTRSRNKIEKIIRSSFWLKPGSFSAYAIAGRKLVSILGEDGLIDGDYLDQVSGMLAHDFSSLLEIEYAR